MSQTPSRPLSRRRLVQTAAAGLGVAAASLGALGTGTPALAAGRPARRQHDARTPFGPLSAAPGALLALPPGFSYEVVSVSGETDIHDGTGTVIGKTPERPDGTLVARRGNTLRIIQNHEASPGAAFPVSLVPGTVYDPGALGGGCTVIETDRTGRRLSEWVALSGTYSNCAGGPTPWGAWLTCEETEVRAGTGTLTKDHGYVFEVFAEGPDQQSPLPIEAWGLAPHEAVVVEPGGGHVYLTEDASGPTGLLYRWTAPSGYRLRPFIAQSLTRDAGTLEALALVDIDGSVLPDLAYVTAAQIGRPFRTTWVGVPDRHASTTSLRKQFAAGQVTHSKKLESAWGSDDGMYFVAGFAFAAADLPADATPHDGQLWFYSYRDATLTLKAYFPYNPLLHSQAIDPLTGLGRSLDLGFDGPDGCHVSPYGTLIISEDGDTANHLLSWSEETGAVAVARNLIVQGQNAGGKNLYSEMTGPCFAPDGSVLVGNVQEPGHVFAIRGPWDDHLG